MPTAPDNYAIFLSPLPKNLTKWATPPTSSGSFMLFGVHSNTGWPWWLVENSTKSILLAVATRISRNYQVLLAWWRIIIPQGNFKYLSVHHFLWLFMDTLLALAIPGMLYHHLQWKTMKEHQHLQQYEYQKTNCIPSILHYYICHSYFAFTPDSWMFLC